MLAARRNREVNRFGIPSKADHVPRLYDGPPHGGIVVLYETGDIISIEYL